MTDQSAQSVRVDRQALEIILNVYDGAENRHSVVGDSAATMLRLSLKWQDAPTVDECDEQGCEMPVFGVIQGLWVCKGHFDNRQIAIYDQTKRHGGGVS